MIRTSLRFRPYCKEIPVTTLIPRTTRFVKISPGICEIFDGLSGKKIQEHIFTFGSLQQFTVTLDLEHDTIVVTGFHKACYVRYRIDADGIHLEKEKSAINKDLRRERLSCGCRKTQDIARIMRRGDLREWLPIWYFLAQSFPVCPDVEDEKGLSVLQELRELIQSNNRQLLSEKLTQLFQEASISLLFPAGDQSLLFGHQIPPIKVTHHSLPQLVLQKSFPLIRSLFFVEERETFIILPHLPLPLHAGKLVNLKCRAGVISLEWTKGGIRRIFFEPTETCSYRFKFSQDIKRFKLRCLSVTKEIDVLHEPINFIAGKSYLIDCFQR